ncbi:regulatory protein RecX [Novosphingobium mathurense]|uniref:Regulatory protein n=1 Tax=Novosphingobium mathurense TaxID=428990 RepID=A0A1U6GSE7_9SPHN|nr:RecX family transcriptional regulator [Novosphingobium mathurense]SLJ86414.1 regulatory protein [Novosphingobium mathurense]
MSSKRRNPQPLTKARLEELALAYVARFATTQAKLRSYLQRKLRERGWADDGAPELDDLVARYAQRGYVDDASWARMKAGSLLRRGYGARRVGEVLQVAGVDHDIAGDFRPDELEQRRAALVLARRRRFGPFSVQVPDMAKREKQIAAMMRAGHRLDIARQIVDADDPDAVEDWVESVSGEDSCA